MGYIEQNLMPDEQVIHRTMLHWNIFLTPFLIGFIGVLLFANGLAAGESGAGLGCTGLSLLVLAFLTSIGAGVSFMTSEFAITNKRVLVKVGFIRRRSLEVFLTKIEGISVNQGILGRMLGYGTIVVIGTGGTRNPFKNIVNPMEFRRQVHSQIQ